MVLLSVWTLELGIGGVGRKLRNNSKLILMGISKIFLVS